MRGTTLLVAAAVATAVLCSLPMAQAEEERGASEAPFQAAEHLGTQRYAVVIGVDDYADGRISDLGHCEKGARDVLSVLVDPHRGGVSEANVQSLLGAKATASAIRAALSRLHELPKEATVFVYFAGHGAQEGEHTYWVPQDANRNHLSATAVVDTEVKALLDQIPAERVVLLMDCCHAPGMVGTKRSPVAGAGVLARYHGTGYATLAAAASEEHAIESEEGVRSVFTHVLVEGLSGSAEDGADGVVDLGELAAYLRSRMRGEVRKRPGLERPVVDLEGVEDPSRFLLTIEPEGLRERFLEEEQAQAERREQLQALATLRSEDRITPEQEGDGRYLLGTLPEGFDAHEFEQRTLFVDLVAGRLASEHLTGALAAIRREDRRTLVVPDEFETIQAAIDAAGAGDTVFVKEGRYDERVVFKTGLSLIGEGTERTVIRIIPGQPEILLAEDCPWGLIEGLQFDGTGGTAIGEWSPDGVHLNRSSVRVIDCLAHSSLGCGLYASGKGCRPYVQATTFEQSGQDGACLSETDGGTIVECISRDNGAVGIQVRQLSRMVVIRACQCVSNKHAGIGVCGASEVTVEGNDCQRNAGHGILVWDKDTTVALVDNTCSVNEIDGIYLVQRSTTVARGNTCSRNKEAGIVISGFGTSATIVDCQFLDHDQKEEGDFGGIVFRDGAGGEVTSSTCDGNLCGILVKGYGTSVQLRDNTCRENKTSGIEFSAAAPGRATGNRCEENRQGITVSRTDVTLQDNTLTRNKQHGILIQGRGTGKASGNRCEENEQDGIHVTGIGTTAELEKNTCMGNGSHGIQFARGAGGTAEDNECGENKGFGVAASGSGTRPTFRHNHGAKNGRAGIGKERGASPVVEGDNALSGGAG